MKKKKKTFILRILIAVLIVIFISSVLRFTRRGTVSISIPEGANSIEISEILKDKGLIKSKSYFLARLYLSPYRGKLRYGNFKLDKNSSLYTIFESLSKDGAKKNTVSVTIPEGYSIEMIEDKVCGLGICTKAEFELALGEDYDYDFLKAIPRSKDIKNSLQGFLYPETYEFYADESAKNIIDTMLAEFEKHIKPLGISNNDLYDIITKASLIEREARLDSERAVIAGVIENRLKNNMKLQIDATVAYAVSDGKYNTGRIYHKDLKVNSKYNTYKYKGLPPGPICCPSLKSIEAAKNPSKHKYLYYHIDTAKNDGSHIFTETYKEHTGTIK